LIRIEVDPALSPDQLDELWRSAWGATAGDYAQRVLPRSLAYLGAFDAGRLVGFVNVAWDGGAHAFVLDTCVHADFQRRGFATMLVRRAAEVAKDRGAEWLHVDFEPHLEGFYRACGFRPTAAGLIDLTK
jgi:GNAT superfamily N-acetyltransferase